MVKSYIQMQQHYKSSLKTKLWDFCWNKDPQAHIWPFWRNQEWPGGHTEWMSTRAFCPAKMQTQFWPYDSPKQFWKLRFRVFLGSLIQLTSHSFYFILLLIRGLGLACCRPWGHKEFDRTWGLSNKRAGQGVPTPIKRRDSVPSCPGVFQLTDKRGPSIYYI